MANKINKKKKAAWKGGIIREEFNNLLSQMNNSALLNEALVSTLHQQAKGKCPRPMMPKPKRRPANAPSYRRVPGEPRPLFIRYIGRNKKVMRSAEGLYFLA